MGWEDCKLDTNSNKQNVLLKTTIQTIMSNTILHKFILLHPKWGLSYFQPIFLTWFKCDGPWISNYIHYDIRDVLIYALASTATEVL